MNDNYYRPIKESYLTDTRLSGDQVRIVNYLAAQKQGYVLNQDWLRGELSIGANKMRTICAELRKLGYLKAGMPNRTGNGRLSQQGSVLNWSKVVSTDRLKTIPTVATDRLKTDLTVPPAETSPVDHKTAGHTDRLKTVGIDGGTNITNMNTTENETTEDETKTSERREPPGEAKEEVPVSERTRIVDVLKRGILTATTVDEITEIYCQYKEHWTTGLSSLAAERKSALSN